MDTKQWADQLGVKISDLHAQLDELAITIQNAQLPRTGLLWSHVDEARHELVRAYELTRDIFQEA